MFFFIFQIIFFPLEMASIENVNRRQCFRYLNFRFNMKMLMGVHPIGFEIKMHTMNFILLAVNVSDPVALITALKSEREREKEGKRGREMNEHKRNVYTPKLVNDIMQFSFRKSKLMSYLTIFRGRLHAIRKTVLLHALLLRLDRFCYILDNDVSFSFKWEIHVQRAYFVFWHKYISIAYNIHALTHAHKHTHVSHCTRYCSRALLECRSLDIFVPSMLKMYRNQCVISNETHSVGILWLAVSIWLLTLCIFLSSLCTTT